MTVQDYQLYHGDCLEIMPALEAGSVDAIICDLPYGITACKWDSVIPLEPLWEQYKRLIKPRGAVVLFGSQPFTSALVMSNLGWFRDEWIWDKNTPTGFLNAKKKPLKAHESIIVFASGQPTYNPQKYPKPYIKDHSKPARTGNGFTKQGNLIKAGVYGNDKVNKSGFRDSYAYPKTTLSYPTGNGWDKRNRLHPTQKPVALLEYLVRTYTNPGDVVLDSTMGSGTTGEACLHTGRRFIGIEKEAEYFKIGQERMDRVKRELAAMLPGLQAA